LRIVAGKLRGLNLAPVGEGDPAAHLRPTSDRVRENLFNVLTGGSLGNPIVGAQVLDLFAGTGALALEALSRGAAHATLIDDGLAARALIHRNIELARMQGSTRMFRRDATQLGEHHGPRFSLVFLDPPYGTGLGERALSSALAGGWLAPRALVVWEDSAPKLLAPFRPRDQRKYGDTHVTILEAPE